MKMAEVLRELPKYETEIECTDAVGKNSADRHT